MGRSNFKQHTPADDGRMNLVDWSGLWTGVLDWSTEVDCFSHNALVLVVVNWH